MRPSERIFISTFELRSLLAFLIRKGMALADFCLKAVAGAGPHNLAVSSKFKVFRHPLVAVVEVEQGQRVITNEYVHQAEVQLRLGGEARCPIGAQGVQTFDAAMSGALLGEGRQKHDARVVMREDALQIMRIPRGDPFSGKGVRVLGRHGA